MTKLLSKKWMKGKGMKRLIPIMAVLAMLLVACGGGSDEGTTATDPPASSSLGDAAAGEEVFASTCASCHGPDATGLEGLGPDLHNNVFVDGLTDDELIAFIKAGRSVSDPANTTGVDMPPKGGNPSLSDDDIADVAAYLRSLN
jgi:mono/diheme cytochrome c family protein